VQRGCELGLFLPAKVGNIDCTFCLDCVQACPHDNIALASRAPGLELAEDRRRSGIGVLTKRPDMAALVVVFVFGALLNAFAMVAPARHLDSWMSATTGVVSDTALLGVTFVLGLGVLPSIVLGGAAWITRMLAGPAISIGATIVRMIYGLVPLGFAMWSAHYAFHFLTGALAIVPVTQSAASDLFGRALLGEPLWRWAGMRPGSVFPIQVGLIVLGALGSLAVTSLIAGREWPGRAGRAAAPWLLLVVLLAAAAIWITWQPMEMRAAGGGG
jgi:hypothetical protein